ESGSGKSVTALSILQLHDRTQCRYPSGSIYFDQRDLLKETEDELRRIRGRDIAMIFQEPMTALNPLQTIGAQVSESVIVHEGLNRFDALNRAAALLERVGIDDSKRRLKDFPHQLSGGQRQRVMIAMALACKPKLLIADEPTTALDVTIQQQILELLDQLQREEGMAVLLISHDLNMVRSFADRICVMEQGKIVEQGELQSIFNSPQHPYTQKLIASEPERFENLDSINNSYDDRPLMIGEAIRCHFPIRAGLLQRQVDAVRAVNDVDIELYTGETLGIVGESGSGKTTLGMSLLRLQHSQGAITFDGIRIDQMAERDLRRLRRNFQVVFQDPFSSLSPRMTIEQIIGEGLTLHYPELTKAQHRERIINVVNEVGLDQSVLHRYPHEFSGGQRQRIAIARVVVLEPKLILLDEPTSALDISIQKQVLELLRELQIKHGMSYLFISHDLNVIRSVSHRVVVMHQGDVVEHGETLQLFDDPQHPYTQILLNAARYKAMTNG
ncbi:MAG: dipeptide ABC transporter ATP-binding protein, partial [Gammaproteobacteria bacterium]|nr:dipeptide ABC transporter ATP-binding protein [Gammaproteobacteria bacterium]